LLVTEKQAIDDTKEIKSVLSLITLDYKTVSRTPSMLLTAHCLQWDQNSIIVAGNDTLVNSGTFYDSEVNENKSKHHKL